MDRLGRIVRDHFVDRALDESAFTPEGPQGDTYYDKETRASAPTGEQLQIIDAFINGKISREEAEQALATLDQLA